METISINAKYQNGKIIPLEPLPKGNNYDAIIILLRPERKIKQKKIINIQPLSLGKIKTEISREHIYHEGE